MVKTRVRIAPSPTGYLHLGNLKASVINWLFSQATQGEFVVRIDDTDQERSKPEYEAGVYDCLEWLGLKWDLTFKQSNRLAIYEEKANYLKSIGRLYPCFETPEELDTLRKKQQLRGLPPIYNRAGLQLTEEDLARYKAQGRKPHWRFKLDLVPVKWTDAIKGEVSMDMKSQSDPVLIREDGTILYSFASVVDDGDYNITHIIRGEDHLTNTATHIQMFEALGYPLPVFAHYGLVSTVNGPLSKRDGVFSYRNMRDDHGYDPLVVLSYVALLGTSESIELTTKEQLIAQFSLSKMSKSGALINFSDFDHLNAKRLASLSYEEAKQPISYFLQQAGYGIRNDSVMNQFWNWVKPNIVKYSELPEWYAIALEGVYTPHPLEASFKAAALTSLPSVMDEQFWSNWTKSISTATGKKGKELFMPLRLALTGKEHGPEMKLLCLLLGDKEIAKRIRGA